MNVDQYKGPRSLVKMKHFFWVGKTNFLKRIKFNWFSASERDTQREEKCITYFACVWNIFAFFVVEIRASANFLFEKKGEQELEWKSYEVFRCGFRLPPVFCLFHSPSEWVYILALFWLHSIAVHTNDSSSRQCYFGQVLLLSLGWLCVRCFFSFNFFPPNTFTFRLYDFLCVVSACVFFSVSALVLSEIMCVKERKRAQNIVFYLIYLNTNHHVLVQLLHSPAGIQSLVQTMKRLLLFLSNMNTLHAFFCCFCFLNVPFRNSYHPKIVEIRCSKRTWKHKTRKSEKNNDINTYKTSQMRDKKNFYRD